MASDRPGLVLIFMSIPLFHTAGYTAITQKKLKPALWTFHSNGKLRYSNELRVVLLSIKLKHPHNS